MFAPVTELQKCRSTEAPIMQEAATLEDVLHNDGAASVMIQFLELKDKRNLRLVAHAGKDAVDKTVTHVAMPGMNGLSGLSFKSKGILYASTLSNSSWRDIKRLGYSPWYPTCSGMSSKRCVEPHGLTQIAEAGLSKLESLTLWLDECAIQDIKSADKMAKAGWKIKQLEISDLRVPSEWFGPLASDANWPLEELAIDGCTDSIADCISRSEWKLKKLELHGFDLSSEGVETLMQGSWVSTVERLTLSFSSDSSREKKGFRAISQASHRAVNLSELKVDSYFDKEAALILAEGSFPILKKLQTCIIPVSGIAVILRKCPKLEEYEFYYAALDIYFIDDPEDAKLVAECYKAGIVRIPRSLHLFKAALADYL